MKILKFLFIIIIVISIFILGFISGILYTVAKDYNNNLEKEYDIEEESYISYNIKQDNLLYKI